MLPGCHVLGLQTGRNRTRRMIAVKAVLVLLAVCLATTSCTAAVAQKGAPAASVSVGSQTHLPAAATSVLTGAQDVIAEGVAQSLFAAAPVVVIASPGNPDDKAAARQALQLHAPLLLTAAAPAKPAAGDAVTTALRTGMQPASDSAQDAAAVVSAALRAQVKALDPSAVLAVGISPKVLMAQLPGTRVVSSAAQLPATKAPTPLNNVALLIPFTGGNTATLAAATTAQVAGAQIIRVRGDEPQADPDVIATLAATHPQRVLAIGSGFGTASTLAAHISVAETGVQLPGGGQVLFPNHLVVALYGHPGTPSLGALGEQDLQASITRAKQVAAAYRTLTSRRVIPALEIIATVAQGSPGPDGEYSYESSVASLRPWVKQATADGLYVVLDLQPGRANLLTQAKVYQSLLEMPDVGLALDPEWKLGPDQVPLKQIGSVSIGEVNSVVTWLAALTARYRLPQKLLVLHQFQLSMISDESALDTRHDDLAILIHMDGQGTPGDKEQTWDAITQAAPPGVFFGWKDFYVKDHPMLDPQQTIDRTPKLSMISYQ